MSLILDALNRSQRERDNKNDIPGIETQHRVDPLPATNIWRRSIPWLSLFIALCVIAWLLFDGSQEVNSPVSIAKPVIQEQPTRQALELKSVPEPLPALVELPPAEKVAADKQVVKIQPQVKASAVEDLYKKKLQPPPETQKVEKKPSPKVESIEKPLVQEQPIDIEKMIALARAEAENVKLAEHSAPFLSELSQQVKDQIPTIYYTQHDYTEHSAQSSVTLNGELLRVGASMAGGRLKVDEILIDSVVLSHRGTQFRLKALNSWINL
jgi:hypothetical protein